MISQEFISIIDDDIALCDNEIKNGNKASRNEVHRRIVSKYQNIIDGFSNGLHNLFYDESGDYCKQNLEIMRQKLVLFKSMGYKNQYSKQEGQIIVNNTNQMKVKFDISFIEARESVQDMTSLNEEEIQEILQKIDELENIVKSNDRKTKKWSSAKEIIKWIADKGIDVGIALLPLVLKIGE